MRARDVFEGVSVAAFARGTRRILAPLTTRHAAASAEHAQVIADLRDKRTKARAIKDPEQRTAALEALKEERPTHPTLIAAGCTVVMAVVGWPELHGHHAMVIAGTATMWVLAALIAGQDGPSIDDGPDGGIPEAAEEPEEAPRDPAANATPTPADARLAVAALGADGTHVALTAVTAHLAAAHPLWKRSGKAARALLGEARVPVRGGVRVDGVSVPGIHRDDVPPLPSPADDALVDVVVAGQNNNNKNNNAGEWATEEGFVLRACPSNPARTIVVARPETASSQSTQTT